MKLFVILSVTMVLTLVSGSRLSAVKRRRESKWDIIHHEYHGPPAPLSKDGRVIDTPEVAEAKANHLAIHAETAADLAKKMAEANALDAAEKSQQVSEVGTAPETSAPIIAQAVEMTPELMAMLLAAAAEEQQQQQQEQQQAEGAPLAEAAPEAAPAQAAEAAPAEGEAGPAPAEAAAVEAPRLEETKPVVESEITNEIDAKNPIYILQRQYEGPLAPLDKDGRVIDTPEVIKAKEAHLLAFDRDLKLSTAKEEESSENNLNAENREKEAGGEAPSWLNLQKKLYIPPLHLVYRLNGPLGYTGPAAPIGNDGRVVDTEEVERAKAEHKKAYEHAEAIAKRHPPKPEDNTV